MHKDFWLERWQSDQLGWHRQDVNPLLIEHWQNLGLDPDARVFVPLCGKSLDMGYLAAQGHRVLGCELSAIAVRAFFDEAGIAYEPRQAGRFVCHQGGAVGILQGDVFDLDAHHLCAVDAVYDRGALIALPREMRLAYARLLKGALPERARSLLLTLEYDQTRIEGPPFSVPTDEVHAIYGDACEVALLREEVTSDIPPRFVEAGLGSTSSPVRQCVWRILPR